MVGGKLRKWCRAHRSMDNNEWLVNSVVGSGGVVESMAEKK